MQAYWLLMLHTLLFAAPPPAKKKPWSSVVLLGDSETLNGEVWGLVEGRQVISGATLKDYATNMTA